MVILGDGAYVGRQNAEETQFGGRALKKRQRWDPHEEDAEKQAQELLAWELEQEQWSEKPDATLLDDPQWQRVGITRNQSTSPFSDDGRQSPAPIAMQGRYSPLVTPRSQTYNEPPASIRPPSHPSSDSYFLQDQRLVQQQMSPVMTNSRHPQQPMSPGMSVRSSHQLEAARSPTSTRAQSPSPSVRSSLSVGGGYNTPEPNYVYSPNSHHGGSEHNHYEASSPFKVFGQETLSMRVRSFSPRQATFANTSMTRNYSYGGQYIADDDMHNRQNTFSRFQTPGRVPSWNSHAPSVHDDADELEAEFARLESFREQGMDYPRTPYAEGRDEENVARSVQKRGYELHELEQYEKETRTQGRNASFYDAEDSDGVIHLEDQFSLGDDDVQDSKNSGISVDMIKELRDEFNDAARRKKALMRTCSMDSNDTDDILGGSSGKSNHDHLSGGRVIPTRKSRWQEKLERFERRGLADAEANLDVSKYPRLQQIRQRRKERLKALRKIQQERAEVWNSLEANWEHMENSMAKKKDVTRNKRCDPEPTPKKVDIVSEDHEEIVRIAKEDESSQTDSLKLSASENSAKEGFASKIEMNGIATPINRNPSPSGEGKDAAKLANGVQVAAATEMVEDLVEDFMARNSLEGIEVEAAGSIKEASLGDQTMTTRKTTGDVNPCSAVSLLKSLSGTCSDDEEEAKDLFSDQVESDGKPGQKEDPPSFGAFITQSMSDVGNKVKQILESVKSNDGKEQQQEPKQQQKQQQPPEIVSQGSDTNEEETSQVERTATDDAGDDETSNGVRDGYEEDDVELDPEVCVNPLQNIVGKHRRIATIGAQDAARQDCMNPLANFGGFAKVPEFSCGPVNVRSKSRRKKLSGYIQPVPSAGSDVNEPTNQQVGLDASLSLGDDMPIVITKKTPTIRALSSKKTKKSKKSKQKKPDSGANGVGTFFTLVDDLLVNNILNIVDEKVVDNMAHTFGFD